VKALGTALLLVIAAAGCATDPGGDDAGAPDGGDAGAALDLAAAGDAAPPGADDDQDGLVDADELRWARDYLPYLSLSPQDGCATGGLIVRVRPHPMDPTLVHVLYDFLYDQDCGLGGHAGDDEAFGVTLDPAQPPPAGIVAIRAISHQGTPCQRISDCGRCAGQSACATLPKAGVPWPALWPSRDKHGSYVNRAQSCTLFTTCADSCDDNPTPASPPVVNVGEPGHPLVHDLTAEGFITSAAGWKNMALFGFDPWGVSDFGGAGQVSGDLVDDAFLTPACP